MAFKFLDPKKVRTFFEEPPITQSEALTSPLDKIHGGFMACIARVRGWLGLAGVEPKLRASPPATQTAPLTTPADRRLLAGIEAPGSGGSISRWGPADQIRGVAGFGSMEGALPVPPETLNGLPVIDAKTYERLYHIDVLAMGREGVTTFDFQGYVREDRPGYKPGVFYRDSLATNGVLKGKDHKGAHVGTDGIIDYSAIEENRRMTSPDQIGKYDIYIEMSGEVQRQLNCVVYDDCAHTVDDFRASMYGEGDERSFEEELRAAQDGANYIVIRLMLDPKEDPMARQNVSIIHHAIVHYIEQKGPGYLLKAMVRRLEGELMGSRKEE